MIHLILLFAAIASGIRPKLQSMLQATPDASCQQWLDSPAGLEFLNCDAGDPGVPVPFEQNGTCQLTTNDYVSYCNNSCYSATAKALDFFLATGTCLPYYEDLYKPCSNNSDCPTLGAQSPRVCYQGFCYNACSNDSDCNLCQDERCVPMENNSTMGSNMTMGNNSTMGNVTMGCLSNQTYYVNGSALVNRTIQNTFRGHLYAIRAACAVTPDNRYCGLIDLHNQTCESLNAQWGCCANTMLPSMKYCQWQNYTNSNFSNLLNCNFTVAPCGGLPLASQFCSFNVTNTTSNSSSSSSSSSSGIMSNTSSSSSSSSGISSSSSSSGIIITNGSSSSSSGSMGSSWLGSSSLITHGNGTGAGNSASGKAISWTMTIALILAVGAHIVS